MAGFGRIFRVADGRDLPLQIRLFSLRIPRATAHSVSNAIRVSQPAFLRMLEAMIFEGTVACWSKNRQQLGLRFYREVIMDLGCNYREPDREGNYPSIADFVVRIENSRGDKERPPAYCRTVLAVCYGYPNLMLNINISDKTDRRKENVKPGLQALITAPRDTWFHERLFHLVGKKLKVDYQQSTAGVDIMQISPTHRTIGTTTANRRGVLQSTHRPIGSAPGAENGAEANTAPDPEKYDEDSTPVDDDPPENMQP